MLVIIKVLIIIKTISVCIIEALLKDSLCLSVKSGPHSVHRYPLRGQLWPQGNEVSIRKRNEEA